MKTLPILLTLLILVLAASCKKEEDPKPEANYTGILKLEYSRTFPEFTAIVVMEVEIDKSGEIYISEPDQVDYSGESEMDLEGSKIKMNETGNITVTSLSGAYKEISGTGYLSVHASTLIDGTQITWGWDDEYGWIQAAEVPFTLEDPVDSPMNFNIDDAVIGGSQQGASIAVPPFGFETFTWTLILTVGL